MIWFDETKLFFDKVSNLKFLDMSFGILFLRIYAVLLKSVFLRALIIESELTNSFNSLTNQAGPKAFGFIRGCKS